MCKLITKIYFCHFHVNDDQFNEKFLLPTTLSDQGDSDKKTQIAHKQHTLLQSNKRKKTKNEKGRRKRLDQMTSKNQIRRFKDFWCPSLEFLLSRIVEKKAGDFLFFSLGEGGHSSTTTQGGKFVMLGFCIICTSSLNEWCTKSSSGADDYATICLHLAWIEKMVSWSSLHKVKDGIHISIGSVCGSLVFVLLMSKSGRV